MSVLCAQDSDLPFPFGPPAADESLGKDQVSNEMVLLLLEPDLKHLDTYLLLLRNENSNFRGTALNALKQLPLNDKIAAGILARLADPQPFVRNAALQAVWDFQMTSPATLKKLERTIRLDPDPPVVRTAMYVVRDFGERMKQLGKALVERLDDEDETVVQAGLEALETVGPPPESAGLFKDRFAKYGAKGIYALSAITPPPASMIPWLRERLQTEKEGEIRTAAAFVLGRCGDSETLLPQARSKDAAERKIGLVGLSGLRQISAEGERLQIEALTDSDEDLRLIVAHGIGISAPPGEPLFVALLRTLADEKVPVRDAARTAAENLIANQRLTHETALRITDAALTETPSDLGLLLGKAKLLRHAADALLTKNENDRALKMYNAASQGLVQIVFKSDYQLCESEEAEVSSLFYNGACAAAKLKRTDLAVKYLRAATDHGFADLELLQSDADLAPLRELDAYHEIWARAVRKATEAMKAEK